MVRHFHPHTSIRRRTVFLPVCRDRDGQPFRAVLHLELYVAEPERGLPRIARVLTRSFNRGRGTPPLDEQHGDEQVGDVPLRNRNRDGLLG